jgi:hypothetical protein
VISQLDTKHCRDVGDRLGAIEFSGNSEAPPRFRRIGLFGRYVAPIEPLLPHWSIGHFLSVARCFLIGLFLARELGPKKHRPAIGDTHGHGTITRQ